MATEIRDTAGNLVGYQLEHTAQQMDNAIDRAMSTTVYDPDGVVAQTGGIVAYIDSLDAEEREY
jgi:hypothetical protein